MLERAHILELIEEGMKDTDLFLVELGISTANQITVLIDSDSGVSITDCMKISRAVEHNLDREEQDFELNVMSPGLDASLVMPRQYAKNIGRTLKIKLVEGGEIKGKVIDSDEEAVLLQTSEKVRIEGRKKKELVVEDHRILYKDINTAKVVITFK